MSITVNKKKKNIYKFSGGINTIKEHILGNGSVFKATNCFEEFPCEKIKELETFINNKWKHVVKESFKEVNYPMKELGIPSLILRVDTNGTNIFEVDANPFGLGFSTLVGGASLVERYAQCLKSLGIYSLGLRVYPSAEKLRPEVAMLGGALEKAGIGIDTNAEHVHMWASNFDIDVDGFVEDLDRSVLYSLESKLNLIYAQKETVLVSKLFPPGFCGNIQDILRKKFVPGYVIKPIDGWGCGFGDPIGLHIVPLIRPYKDYRGKISPTKAEKIIKEILEQGKGDDYLIQPFYPPIIGKVDDVEGVKIYRLYFIFNPDTQKYEFAEGWFNVCRTMRAHGGNDTLAGWVFGSTRPGNVHIDCF